MKNLISYPLIVLSSVFTFAAPDLHAQLSDGLVSYFDFESGFANHPSASGPNGTALNGASAGVGGGVAGNAMQLNDAAANMHMNVPVGFGDGATLGQSLTISCWYNLNDFPAPNGTGRYFVFESQTDFDISYGLRNLDLGEPGFNDGQVFTAGASTNVSDAGLPGWRNVIQTYMPDGANITIQTYIDGVAVGEIITNAAGFSDTGINFGAARGSQTNRGFDGLIDEVALWDRALSTAEIATVHALGLNAKPLVDDGPPDTAPAVVSFSADPTEVPQGGSATLAWEVTGAGSVTLSHGFGNVAASDSQTVTPNDPSTYTLVAIDGNAVATAQVTVGIVIPPADLSSGLVGYYDGEDNNNDPSASHPAALTNSGVGVGVGGGVAGNAFQFDNTPGDTLTATTSYSSSPGSDLGDTFTIAAWYNLDPDAPLGNGGNRHFVWEDSFDFDFSFWIDNDGGPASPTGVQAMWVDDGTTNFGDYTKGTWQHVAQTVVSSGGTTTVSTYVDGALVGSDSGPTSTMGNISPTPGLEDSGINFGRARTPASDRPFDGLIDEIGIWSRALTGEEIGLVFERGSNGAGLLAPLEELALTDVTYDLGSSMVTVEFASIPGKTYAVERSSTLTETAPAWDERTDNLRATSNRTTFADTLPDPKMFYRVRLLD